MCHHADIAENTQWHGALINVIGYNYDTEIINYYRGETFRSAIISRGSIMHWLVM